MSGARYRQEYDAFLVLLREVRQEADLTQADLARRLSQTQSYVSKCERGERRVDVVELHALCSACGITLHDFVQRLESTITEAGAGLDE